jgi:hypothetical protein
MDGLLYPRRQSPRLLPAGAFELDRTHPLTAALLGYWPLTGDGRDYSRNGYHGSGQGSPTTAVGALGPCLQVNGSSQAFKCGSAQVTSSSQTISIWVCETTRSSSNQLFAMNAGVTGSTAYNEILSNSGVLQYVNTSSTYVNFSPSYTLPLNTWTHLVFVQGAGTTLLYANGVLYSTVSSVNHDDWITPLWVGAWASQANSGSASANWFTGQFSNVAVWNRQLSAAEVARLYVEPGVLLRPVSRRLYYAAPTSTAVFGRGSAASFNKASAVGTVPLFG